MATAASSSPSLTASSRPAAYTYSAPSSPQISTRPRPGATPAATAPMFKAPAHKHAHHLHSIPPREKSTRTLILDHLLWVHARTRLQQARAELGMAVSGDAVLGTGESPRSAVVGMDIDKEPLAAAEDQDALSDGEDVLKIKFGAKDYERNERSPAEDQHEATQNLSLAHTLRLRADGVEKVLIAMLDQPPEVQPPYSDDDAPRTPPAIHGAGEHFFPNGVRLRLALSTLVNDLFARDTPTPLSPRSSNTPAFQARNAQTPSSTPQIAPVSNASRSTPTFISLPLPSSLASKGYRRDDDLVENSLPTCLLPLSSISSFSFDTDRNVGGPSLPSFSSFTRSNANPTTVTLPPIKSASSSVPQVSFTNSRPRRATGRALSLYEAGTDPATANSPPSHRCPRHLHHTCQICAPAQAPALTAGSGPSLYTSGASPKSPMQTRSAIILGSNGKSRISGGAATGLASWKTGAGIGAGLASAGVEGTVLRRRTVVHHTTSHPTAKDVGPCSVGGKLAELMPRFIRLSALVAVELGREAKDKEDDAARAGDKRPGSSAGRESEDERDRDEDGAGNSATGQAGRASALKPSDVSSPYLLSLSFRPSHEWYALLTGLLTRAVLEGYLSRAWKGPLGMECLLGVGLGLGPHIPNLKERDEDEFIHLDPDDCPSLLDAAKILFPNLCRQVRVSDGPEAAYETEMLERISEFLTVPPSTPDLSTHFEDLAYKFPTEPVERAIVRFCEAVASWRGHPELENHKKSAQFTARNSAAQTTTQMSVDSLVQSTAGTLQTAPARLPKPAIEKYFTKGEPLSFTSSKRRRSTTTSPAKPTSESRSRKPHFETSDEWTGPYGI
ncbi:hypothetical protein DFH11DRAFT_1503779 [Phellopilus nigrolimitatus]|nr:hypothetical protein DFH11DRAFT_1503779 [Phellopilus nigrolimitatus]